MIIMFTGIINHDAAYADAGLIYLVMLVVAVVLKNALVVILILKL